MKFSGIDYQAKLLEKLEDMKKDKTALGKLGLIVQLDAI